MKEFFTNSQFWSMLAGFAAIVVVVASFLSAYLSAKDESKKYQHLLGQIMGGDSFPIVIANSYKGDPPVFKGNPPKKVRDSVIKLATIVLTLNGKYPVRNLKIRAYDIGDFREKSSATYHTNLAVSDLNIPGPYPSLITSGAVPPEDFEAFDRSMFSRDIDVFKPKQRIILRDVNIENIEAKGVDIYCDSDYQSWFINVRYLKNKNGEWNSAVRVRRIGDRNSAWKNLKVNVADNYPEKPDGIIWYKDGG